MSGIVRFVLIALAASLGGHSGVSGHEPAPVAKPVVAVQGNQLVDGNGEPMRLLGVNRSGTEYRCQQGYGIFEGPTDMEAIEAIKSWDANAVRVPLNESCWLGTKGIEPELGGEAYREAIVEWVERLEEAGLYVVLTLQFASPNGHPAREIIPMPDIAHAPAFWASVARTFRTHRGVLFDLYSEPHEVSWECWQVGCQVTSDKGVTYEAVGMQTLVEVIRATGARQPLLLSGVNYAHDLDEWEAHLPPDPLDAEVASLHTYNFGPCTESCHEDLATIAEHHPVVAAELGEDDCKSTYIDEFMAFADEHGISYLGWAWNAGHGWRCNSGPALIRSYDGTPTRYGAGLMDHLRALHRGY